MKILVTGGLGTLGQPLVQELRRRGHETWACDLAHHHDRQYVRCDITRFRQIHELLAHRRFDCIYHLAAETGRWNGEDFYENLWLTNVVGTKHILRLQEEFRFQLVFLSSSEVYGDWPDAMAESVTEFHAVRHLNDFAMTKWISEAQIQNSAQMNHTESVRIRLFNTYGPGEPYTPYSSAICKFIYSALSDLPYEVYINHRRTALYIDDCIQTLVRVVDRFRPGDVYNVGGSDYVDMKRISDIVLDIAGKSDKLVIYKDHEPFTARETQLDGARAARDLSHTPKVPLEDGIRRTIDWMRQTYFSSRASAPAAPPARDVQLPQTRPIVM